MNKKEKKILKEALLAYREKIAAGMRHLTENSLNKNTKDASGDLSSYSFHMADMATDNYDRDFNLGLASQDGEIINKIDESLQKLEENTYGKCEGCNCKIPVERLKALPFASLCIKCKEEEDSKVH